MSQPDSELLKPIDLSCATKRVFPHQSASLVYSGSSRLVPGPRRTCAYRLPGLGSGRVLSLRVRSSPRCSVSEGRERFPNRKTRIEIFVISSGIPAMAGWAGPICRSAPTMRDSKGLCRWPVRHVCEKPVMQEAFANADVQAQVSAPALRAGRFSPAGHRATLIR